MDFLIQEFMDLLGIIIGVLFVIAAIGVVLLIAGLASVFYEAVVVGAAEGCSDLIQGTNVTQK